jgi:hypothetical protein
VPGVTGESQRIAEAQLAQSGIAVRAISEIRSPSFGPDAPSCRRFSRACSMRMIRSCATRST